MDALRHDAVPLRAVVDRNTGYLRDSPVIGRAGVQTYRDVSGRVIREYRSPEVLFAAETLASLAGIPIVDEPGHKGLVTSATVRQHGVGAVLSQGRQDGQNIVADIVIYDQGPVRAGRKELSLAYHVRLDHTPGTTPQGEAYDQQVTAIAAFNHLAIVAKGRAGVARLRLDGADAASTDITDDTTPEDDADPAPLNTGAKTVANMVSVRLDNLSYEAAPEVSLALDRARDALTAAQGRLTEAENATSAAVARADAAATRVEALTGERDAQTARADAAEARVTQAQTDAETRLAAAVAEATAAGRARAALEALAEKHGVRADAAMDDRAIKTAVIAKLNPSLDLTSRPDVYVDVRFDATLEDAAGRQTSGNQQVRMAVPPASKTTDTVTMIRSAAEARDLANRAQRAS